MSVNKIIRELEKIINERFHKKYNIEPNNYNIIKIENIIFNDKTHLVSEFKDLMILNDFFEFLSKFYPIKESSSLLSKCFKYYPKNCSIFPNLSGLLESKYLYININNKKRILDENFETNYDNKNKEKIIEDEEIDKKIFDNTVYNSIFRDSNFSTFDMRKQNEKLDSINDINNLINEIEKNNDEDVDNFNLEILNLNQNKIFENNNGEVFKNKRYKSNFCYNKFKNIYTKKIMFNRKNQKVYNNPKENTCSSIYVKSIIKEKILNKKINLQNKTDNVFSTINMKDNPSLFLLNSTKNKKELIQNNSGAKKIYIYPFKTPNKLRFSVKKRDSDLKTKSLKSIKIKEINNKLVANKKNELNLELYPYTNKPNNTFNHIVQNQNSTKTSISKGNNDSAFNYKINKEMNDKNDIINLLGNIQKENAIFIFNNNCIYKENNNIKYKKIEHKYKINFPILNKIKPVITKEKNKIYQISKKKKSFNNIIVSINNKIRKESKSNISQRILYLMKENKNLSKAHKKNSCGELNKNIISLKKIFQHKKSRIEQKKNLRNKLMLSFENSNIKNLYISKSNVIYNTTFKNSNNN